MLKFKVFSSHSKPYRILKNGSNFSYSYMVLHKKKMTKKAKVAFCLALLNNQDSQSTGPLRSSFSKWKIKDGSTLRQEISPRANYPIKTFSLSESLSANCFNCLLLFAMFFLSSSHLFHVCFWLLVFPVVWGWIFVIKM